MSATDTSEESTGLRWWAGRILSLLVLFVMTAGLVATVVVPKLAGAQPYTILTQSMEPSYPPGALVIVRPGESYGVGEAITYQIRSGDPEVVTHRIVSTGVGRDGERVFVTQGDNNPRPDAGKVEPGQIRGAVWYHVPYLGYVNNWLTGSTRTLVVGIAAGALFLYAAVQFSLAARDRRSKGRHTV
ncbi:signal peptidase I [Rhodococcus sp. BP-316]|uniref:signal peptidase I n=1 Tax=Rhodococcus sp. BP-316 TaxID=2739445 RepID=UPI001C9B8286|nr:signal peptidase I [Rhodococcus sp. BP-316]MBY6682756.1 signal peptidase I [Rhodococcus sp. BP-316]